MSKSSKIRVAVLYGGHSCEHEVSLASAKNVIENLDRSLFEVIPIGIDNQGDAWKFLHQHSQRSFDVVLPIIHGTLGEDGCIQGLFELANIPYVGCGVLSSAVGMDKEVSKRLIMHAGISVLPFMVIKRPQWDQNPKQYTKLIAEQFSYPVFVKPANMGSSIGVHKIKHETDLSSAINDAYQYDTKVIIEKAIQASEIEIALLESEKYGADPIVSVVGEIRASVNHEFYSYASKYLDQNGAELFIPATISSELQNEAREIAKNIFSALNCEGMARIDLFVEDDTHCIYFNEINTIPGFTEISMYPKLMAASAMSYSELLTHLIKIAMNRHFRKNKLKREYLKETNYA